MKNLVLENFGVVEMDTKEMREIDGGIVPLLIIGAVLLLGGCTTERHAVDALRAKNAQDSAHRDTTHH